MKCGSLVNKTGSVSDKKSDANLKLRVKIRFDKLTGFNFPSSSIIKLTKKIKKIYVFLLYYSFDQKVMKKVTRLRKYLDWIRILKKMPKDLRQVEDI